MKWLALIMIAISLSSCGVINYLNDPCKVIPVTTAECDKQGGAR